MQSRKEWRVSFTPKQPREWRMLPRDGARNKLGGTSARIPRLTKADIPAALAAHDRAQAASDAIRAKVGLDPVPENAIVRSWREQISGKASTAVTVAPVDELRKAVEAQGRANARLIVAIRSAIDAGESKASCARQLGMTRQGLHKMLQRV